MRQTLSKGMVVAAAAATGVLSLYGTAALADSNAQSLAQGSPGVLSGNSIQVPVHVPVNVCGNSVDVAALLNPAFGNSCANGGHSATHHHTGYGNDSYGDDEPTPASYGKPDPTPTPTSYGHDDPTPPAYGSPDPTPTPTSYGSDEPTPTSYGSDEPTPTPTSYGSDEPTPTPTSYGSDEPTPLPSYGSDEPTPPGSYGNDEPPTLPHTGGNAKAMIATSAASAALIMAGAVLYRRGRTAARR
ncbi:chaplin [Streptomyces sp. WP-1]|uniref:chaplin n=1 Tax=Streptomyces sp. WP-1 TaxID=3041497 RepID=UPI002647380C|nr:chaplin family protein [Streptomyces sp. WP-1]WKE71606.1 chaplin family protein [Streptomyces sp. WP-1]